MTTPSGRIFKRDLLQYMNGSNWSLGFAVAFAQGENDEYVAIVEPCTSAGCTWQRGNGLELCFVAVEALIGSVPFFESDGSVHPLLHLPS